ncbi:MAG: TIGR03936 family radical SAM-associated protein [Clostridia bacterium]
MSNSIRFKFIRGEEVKYISHLDLMRFFDRALRRCDIPIAYSIGFNPHPNMIFGLPLTVGVTSECEYADFEFSVPLEPDEFVGRISPQLPKGIEIIDAKIKNAKENIMAIIVFASYNIIVGINDIADAELLQDKLNEFLEAESIIAKKENKKGIKLIDIKPMIHELRVSAIENGQCRRYCIDAYLSAGNASNLRPELLIKAFSNFLEREVRIEGIHRKGLYAAKNGEVMDPMDNEMIGI